MFTLATPAKFSTSMPARREPTRANQSLIAKAYAIMAGWILVASLAMGLGIGISALVALFLVPRLRSPTHAMASTPG